MENTHPWVQFIDFYFELALNYKHIKSVLGTRWWFHMRERNLKGVFSTWRLIQCKLYSTSEFWFDSLMLICNNQDSLAGVTKVYAAFSVDMFHLIRLIKDQLVTVSVFAHVTITNWFGVISSVLQNVNIAVVITLGKTHVKIELQTEVTH